MRCSPCQSGRRSGEPCDVAVCLCRCHRQGVAVVEGIFDKSLSGARSARTDAKLGLLSSAVIRYYDETTLQELAIPEGAD